jgi:hypothetical protein
VQIRYSVHDSLFTAFDDEPSWPVHHRIIYPKLTGPETLRSWFPAFRDTAGELIGKWKGTSEVTSKEGFEVLQDLNRLNLEATTLSLYGQKLNGLSGPPHPILQAMEDAPPRP